MQLVIHGNGVGLTAAEGGDKQHHRLGVMKGSGGPCDSCPTFVVWLSCRHYHQHHIPSIRWHSYYEVRNLHFFISTRRKKRRGNLVKLNLDIKDQLVTPDRLYLFIFYYLTIDFGQRKEETRILFTAIFYFPMLSMTWHQSSLLH